MGQEPDVGGYCQDKQWKLVARCLVGSVNKAHETSVQLQ